MLGRYGIHRVLIAMIARNGEIGPAQASVVFFVTHFVTLKIAAR